MHQKLQSVLESVDHKGHERGIELVIQATLIPAVWRNVVKSHVETSFKNLGIFTSDTHSVSHSDCSCTPVKDYNSEQQVFHCLCLHCAVLGVEQPGDDGVMRRARRDELPPLYGEWPAVAFTTRINGHGHKRKLFFALQQQRNVCHY